MLGFKRLKRKVKPSQNRRRFQRVTASYYVMAWGENKSITANLIDLSFRGAMLQTKAKLQQGTLLTFTLRCEHGSGATTARVVRQTAGGLAIAFTQPTDDFLAVLVEAVVPSLDR